MFRLAVLATAAALQPPPDRWATRGPPMDLVEPKALSRFVTQRSVQQQLYYFSLTADGTSHDYLAWRTPGWVTVPLKCNVPSPRDAVLPLTTPTAPTSACGCLPEGRWYTQAVSVSVPSMFSVSGALPAERERDGKLELVTGYDRGGQ